MGESKSRIEPVTCPDCGLRGEVRLAQSGFKNNFPNVVQCKHRQGMAVVTCPSLRPEIDAAHKILQKRNAPFAPPFYLLVQRCCLANRTRPQHLISST